MVVYRYLCSINNSNMKKYIYILSLSTFFFSCGENETIEKVSQNKVDKTYEFTELDEQARKTFGALNEVNYDISNPLIQLGKSLYFDNRLSKDNTQSCNTCHNLDTYGVDNKSFSEGNDGGLGGRNSPTTFNAALHMTQFWDGREPDVEAQAGGPVLNPVEMAMPNEKAVIDRLSTIDEYKVMFAKAFPNDANSITYANMKTAIGAYERLLITPSKFDKYMNGDNDALSGKEKRGMKLFMDAGCITCHAGPLLGGNMYQKFGLVNDYWEYTKSENIDKGRFDVTNKESDLYVFKVPSLRNIEKTAPYFHDGSVQSLKDAIQIMGKTQLNRELSVKEVSGILYFLETLTGEVNEDLKK